MHFETQCGSSIGSAHRRAGRNGQDGWAIERDGDGGIAMVVTDGCGSAKHSEVGAKIGARIVAREMLADGSAGAVVAQLAQLARIVDAGDYLLFTIVGALITPHETVVFHAGDGFFAVNGETQRIGPYPNNAPPYLAYALAGEVAPEWTIAYRGPTCDVESILIATDGVEPIAGELRDFLHVSRNPDAIRRRLFRDKHLDDDATVALARRRA